ncbi:MAG: hypothetical protein N2Z58_07330 [Fervidobacterium sp.]|nr:hypothetical protein [Fervidobacterium sp.]
MLVLLSVLFGTLLAVGDVRLQLVGHVGQSVSWSQTLTFSERQWIRISWDKVLSGQLVVVFFGVENISKYQMTSK